VCVSWGPRQGLIAVVAVVVVTTATVAFAEPAGRVVGTVRVASAMPARPPIRVTMDPEVCGETLPDESLVVGAAGGVRDVVVVLRGGPAAEAAAQGEAVVDNRGCRFVPRVQTIVRGQGVRVRNSDRVLHNAHPVLMATPEVTVANIALGVQGQTMDLTRRMKEKLPPEGEALIRLGCDVHPWMRGWLFVVPHARAAVTDPEGVYSIRDVPPGSYTASLWHETLGRTERSVAVTAGAAARLDVTLAP
jgi:hypothetical protein